MHLQVFQESWSRSHENHDHQGYEDENRENDEDGEAGSGEVDSGLFGCCLEPGG